MRQAIIILYSGIEPDQETVRAAVEAVAKGVHMDTQVMDVHVLDETEISQALVASVAECKQVNHDPFSLAIANVVDCVISTEYSAEKTALYLQSKYISDKISGGSVFTKSVEFVIPNRLATVKGIKDSCKFSLKEAKDIVDLLYSTVESCRVHLGTKV